MSDDDIRQIIEDRARAIAREELERVAAHVAQVLDRRRRVRATALGLIISAAGVEPLNEQPDDVAEVLEVVLAALRGDGPG